MPQPPPTCPKCGSHRTQVVGISDEGQTIVVRCNACGARSEVAMPREEREAELAPAGGFRRVEQWPHT